MQTEAEPEDELSDFEEAQLNEVTVLALMYQRDAFIEQLDCLVAAIQANSERTKRHDLDLINLLRKTRRAVHKYRVL
jgi:hypothetical protein